MRGAPPPPPPAGDLEAVNFFAVVETPRIWMHDGSVAEVHEDVPVAWLVNSSSN